MFMLLPVVAAVVLVFLGYAALWSAYQEKVPAGISKFGRIMSIILFVFAGLVIIFGATMRPPCGGPGMMGKMEQMGRMDNNGPCMNARMGHGGQEGDMQDMGEMRPPFDKEQVDTPAQPPAPQEIKGRK